MTERANADFVVREGCAAMDFGRVHAWLAASYWVPGITRATVEHEARHSALVIGAFATDGAQIGYARVISDKSRFAYFSDVVVDESQRGRGVGRAMVQHALSHPELTTVTIWMLLTRDAHGVYAPLGFRPITAPESTPDRWMVWRKCPPAG
jgi:GNAT superfamily N-acetyltransferase